MWVMIGGECVFDMFLCGFSSPYPTTTTVFIIVRVSGVIRCDSVSRMITDA